MAGESPDRSKQRESSAEPTSGSAIPVPESRPDPTPADGAERPDPRLAVAREHASAKPAATAPRGGVDTATRVLSRQELDAVRAKTEKAEAENEDAGADDAARANSEAEAEGANEESASPTGRGAGAGDAEAKAEDAGADAEDARADAEGDDTAPGADDAEHASAQTEGSVGRGADAEGDDTDAAADDASTQGTASEGTEGEADDAEDADASARSAEGAAGGKGDDRLRAAVAAWVASGDAEDAEGEKSAQGAEEGAQDADEDAESLADADDAVAEGQSDAGPDGPSAASAADDAPAAADGEDAPQGPPAPDDESRTGGAGGNTKAEGEAEAEPKAEAAGKAVDQPTAVFKAVRPDKPAVDQPTTMLKAPKPDAAPAPETPSERTSKFVALKPDIKPDTPKTPSPSPAPAPASAPAATPDVTAAVPQVGPERTTQQPLPPRPPLDLLAELTNTPPPPDTPVRTALRRVKIWTPLVLLLVIVFAVVQSMRPLPAPTLDLTAEDSYTFDGGKIDIPWPAEGQAALDVDGIGTFGSSGDQKPVPIASVAKVMTAYVILREHPLDSGAEGPNITIDQAAEDQSDAGQESTVNVTKGDKISQREALESILIASANNVARLLARWDAGSEKAFVTKMNAAADDLGMTNTTYTDPSGLNNTTVSTAVDQVKLAKAAMKYPAFREVAAMMSYDDYKGHNHGNWNQLVGKNNVVGIKTGTTTSALGNLVFAAKKEIGGETRTVVGAVVRQPDAGGGILAAALDSGDKLIRAAQDALASATILKKGDVVGYVDDGLGGRTPVVATKDVKAVGWSGLKVKLTFAPDDVPHIAKAGTTVGALTVGDGSSGAVKIPVALQTDLAEPGFTDKLTRVG